MMLRKLNVIQHFYIIQLLNDMRAARRRHERSTREIAGHPRIPHRLPGRRRRWSQIATDLNQLRSGCHRTLQELIRYGYVRQMPQRGDYALTTKMASMGLSFLSKSGVSSTSPSR